MLSCLIVSDRFTPFGGYRKVVCARNTPCALHGGIMGFAALLVRGVATFAALAFAVSDANADLRKSIAQQFNIEEGSFILNLPPRPGCLPGSIFTDDLRFPLARTKSDDADLDRGPTFIFTSDFTFDAGANVSAGMSQWFGLAAKASSASDVKLEFKNARVVEMLGPELKKRVLRDVDARDAATRKVIPFVVARSYEGTITVKMSRKQGASAEAWAQIKKDAIDAKLGAKIGSDDTVEYTVSEPFVFAFEVVRATYVAQHLGPSPDDVVLTKIPETMFKR